MPGSRGVPCAGPVHREPEPRGVDRRPGGRLGDPPARVPEHVCRSLPPARAGGDDEREGPVGEGDRGGEQGGGLGARGAEHDDDRAPGAVGLEPVHEDLREPRQVLSTCLPLAVRLSRSGLRAGMDRGKSFADRGQAVGARVRRGLGIGRGRRMGEGESSGRVQEPERVVVLCEVGSDGHGGRDGPLEGRRIGPLRRGVSCGRVGLAAEVEHDCRLGGRGRFLLPDHELAVPGGRGPVDPAHGVAVAVLPRHDVVVARGGLDAGRDDAVGAPGPREDCGGERDRGGGHHEPRRVPDPAVALGEAERVRVAGLDGPDAVQPAPGAAELVAVAAEAVGRDRPPRIQEGRARAERGGQVFGHGHAAREEPAVPQPQAHLGRGAGLDDVGPGHPPHLHRGPQEQVGREGRDRDEGKEHRQLQEVPPAHDLGGDQREHGRRDEPPSAGRERALPVGPCAPAHSSPS